MFALKVLREARRAVPFLNYAFGVVGLAAAASLIVGLIGYDRLAIFATALVLIGAVLLFAVAQLVTSQSRASVWAGIVILWTVIAMFVIFAGFTVSAFARGEPCNWADYIGVRSACAGRTMQATVIGDPGTAFAGGPGEPNPGCPNHNVEVCVYPKNRGKLILGTESLVIENRTTERTEAAISKRSELQICYLLTATTGACETRYEITAKASATEEFTPPQ